MNEMKACVYLMSLDFGMMKLECANLVFGFFKGDVSILFLIALKSIFIYLLLFLLFSKVAIEDPFTIFMDKNRSCLF